MIDGNYQGETGLFHKEGKEEYVWNTEDTLGYLLALSFPWLRSMENFNRPNHIVVLMAQTLQEWTFGLFHKVKNNDHLNEGFAGGEENAEWVVKEVS